MSEQRPSSIPPSKAKWQWALLGLVIAVTGLIAAIAQRIVATPLPSAERGVEKPDPKKSPVLPEIPRELDGEAAARFVRASADPELARLKDQVDAERAVQCVLLREVVFMRARLVEIEGGKRGKEARGEFVRDTSEWTRCPVLLGDGKRQELPSLRDAADSALRR